MSAIQQAFQTVGYKPTRPQTAKQMMRFNLDNLIKPTLEKVVREVFAPTIKVRKVQVKQVGSHYKARYEGRETYVFGETPTQAAKRLEWWEEYNERQGKP